MGFFEKRPTALLAGMMLAAMLGLAACGGTGGASSAASDGASSAQASAAAESDAGADGEGAEGLYGSPWVTATVAGNLPDERPSAKDDFYTYANYDFLVAHQQDPADYMTSTADEVQEAAVAAIKDESRTDHDIAQMRILYNQAADFDTLKEIGFPRCSPTST